MGISFYPNSNISNHALPCLQACQGWPSVVAMTINDGKARDLRTRCQCLDGLFHDVCSTYDLSVLNSGGICDRQWLWWWWWWCFNISCYQETCFRSWIGVKPLCMLIFAAAGFHMSWRPNIWMSDTRPLRHRSDFQNTLFCVLALVQPKQLSHGYQLAGNHYMTININLRTLWNPWLPDCRWAKGLVTQFVVAS